QTGHANDRLSSFSVLPARAGCCAWSLGEAVANRKPGGGIVQATVSHLALGPWHRWRFGIAPTHQIFARRKGSDSGGQILRHRHGTGSGRAPAARVLRPGPVASDGRRPPAADPPAGGRPRPEPDAP